MSERLVPILVKRILVAVDGSEHSKKAVELAVDLADKWSADIYLIHVWEIIPKGYEDYLEAEGIPLSELYSSIMGRDQALEEAEARVKVAGINVRCLSLQGDPADEIIKAAKENEVDLIVMGNRGLGGFSKAVMGSVSTKVCNHAHCTCITVK